MRVPNVSIQKSLLTCLVCLVAFDRLAIADAPITNPTVSAQSVNKCVDKAIQFLYSHEKNGTWDPPARQPDINGATYDWSSSWTNWGGPTALITYSLLAAGESPNDPRIKSAIDFLKTADLKGTYAIGMRSEVWSHLPTTPEIRQLMMHDADLLHSSMITQGSCKGMWSYTGHGADFNLFDHSNSQYGVLGLWSAADIGLEIPANIWEMMDQAWRAGEQPSGGWAYRRAGDPSKEFTVPRFTMTAAGIATLYLTDDYLAPGAGINCEDNVEDPAIQKGLDWLGDHFGDLMHADDIIVGAFNYGLYGLERVGVASGNKYIGKVDWYQFGADQLIKLQSPEGGWRMEQPAPTPATTTALGLLFLAYGRAPVAIDKLQWELQTTTTSARRASWNERPRDIANLVHWMSKQTEAPVKWQSVSLHAPTEELHNAPILYLSGNQALNFSTEDLAKLKAYVEQGGLILGSANCISREFSESFRKLGTKLFPDYPFRELPADHIIYTGEQYLRTKWRNKPSVLGLSNGVRELMLLLPTGDAGRLWQLQNYMAKPEAFDLASNIVLYASDRQVLDPQRDSYFVTTDSSIAAAKTAKLARLSYGGNWNPEPGGWKRLAAVMHNENKVDLTVMPVKLGEGKLDPSVIKIAHLTGTTAITLTAGEQAELKKFIDAGGTLLIDAAGGSTAFGASAEELIRKITPPGSTLAPLDSTNVSISTVTSPVLRRFATARFGKSKATLPRGVAIAGRIAVFYSPLDLSAGLVGQPIDGIAGYEPETATKIVSAVVAYANDH